MTEIEDVERARDGRVSARSEGREEAYRRARALRVRDRIEDVALAGCLLAVVGVIGWANGWW